MAGMLGSATSVFLVFSHQSQPVQLFNLSSFSLDLSQLSGYSYPGDTKQSSSPTELFPASAMNDVANLSAHFILMGFLVSVGYKVASLGVQMLRPIEVQLKSIETSKNT
jgi:hypothetical protein